MSIWVDGKFLGADAAPKPAAGVVAPFETIGAHGGDLPLWPRHLARLQSAVQRLKLSWQPTPELRAAASRLALEHQAGEAILRLLLVPDRGTVHTVLTARSGVRVGKVRLVPTVVERKPGGPPADLKAMPRTFYDAVLQQAQDGGADDGVVVTEDGEVLETAVGNLWLRLDGTWVTPPLDGRVLPGIARAILLERARATGLPVAERSCSLDDVHRAEAIAHSNAVYGPRPAELLGSGPAAVEIVDRELGKLWDWGRLGS